MTRIFTGMTRAIRQTAPGAVVYGVVISVDDAFFGKLSVIPSLIVAVGFAHYVHRTVLLGHEHAIRTDTKFADGTPAPASSILRFLLVNAGFWVVCLLVAVVLAFTLAMAQFDREVAILFAAPTAVATLWVALASFGTLLPAAALGLPFSPASALKAARQTGLRVAGQLLVFPALFLSVLVALRGTLRALVLAPDLPRAAALIEACLFNTLGALAPVMTVVILCRAFVQAYPLAAQQSAPWVGKISLAQP